MKGEQHLTRPQEYAQVQATGHWRGGRLLGIKHRPNGLQVSRWGIIVSKRVGGAVVRNRVRRRLREIMRGLTLKAGQDIVISTRPESASAAFGDLKELLVRLLAESSLLE